jgi:hypothetical protein
MLNNKRHKLFEILVLSTFPFYGKNKNLLKVAEAILIKRDRKTIAMRALGIIMWGL